MIFLYCRRRSYNSAAKFLFENYQFVTVPWTIQIFIRYSLPFVVGRFSWRSGFPLYIRIVFVDSQVHVVSSQSGMYVERRRIVRIFKFRKIYLFLYLQHIFCIPMYLLWYTVVYFLLIFLKFLVDLCCLLLVTCKTNLNLNLNLDSATRIVDPRIRICPVHVVGGLRSSRRYSNALVNLHQRHLRRQRWRRLVVGWRLGNWLVLQDVPSRPPAD